jgi:hypothetical protein
MATRSKRQIDALQKELEPVIYSYFGLTEPEITLVENTNDILEPGSPDHLEYTQNRDPRSVRKIDKIEKSLDNAFTCGLKKVLTMQQCGSKSFFTFDKNPNQPFGRSDI